MAISWFAKLFGSTTQRPASKRKRPRTTLEIEILEARITPQATRTWVSGLGDDANPDSRTAPGKTFAGAESKTAAGGEVDALDSGGFGTINITKALTIDGAGNMAGISSPGTNGINVNAGPNDVVILRGLTIDGYSQGSLAGLNGIQINSAGVVDLENCVIENFSGIGVNFAPGSSGAVLVMNNTVVRNCAGGGVLIQPTGGFTAIAALNHVQSELNMYGVEALDRTTVTVENSVASGNATFGFFDNGSASGATTRMFLQNDTVSSSGAFGVLATGANTNIGLSNVNTFGNSSLGTVAAFGGAITSFSNNRDADNSRGFTPIPIDGTSTAGGASRTWVSGTGDDVNPGSRTAPDKTFAGALSRTATGGEIDVLDPGGFGSVTILKALTIDGSGSFGSILPNPGTDGIIVNAPVGAVVVLRGLKLQGAGSGVNGIHIIQAGAVFVENCVIQNFTQNGIDFTPTNPGCQLFVENTVVENCQIGGVNLNPGASATNTRALVDATVAQFCVLGFVVADNADATFTNSAALANSVNGFTIGAVNASAVMNLDNCVSSENKAHGLMAQGGGGSITARVNMSRMTISGNAGFGLLVSANPGNTALYSFGNIQVLFNGTDGGPTGTLPQT